MAIRYEILLKEDLAMVLPAWQMKGACQAPEKGVAKRAERADTSI